MLSTRHDPLREKAWRIRVVTSDAALDALAAPWKDLVLQSDATLFQTYEWQRTWWKYFGGKSRRGRLYVVVLSCGKELIAIAPMYMTTQSFGALARARRLVFIGRGISDYLDFIVRKGWEIEAYARLAEHFVVNRKHWDVISLEDVPNHSQTRVLFPDAFMSRGMTVTVAISTPCPRVALNKTWELYYETLPTKVRKQHRSRLEQALVTFDASFETVSSRDGHENAVVELMEILKYRRAARDEPNEFSSADRQNFQLEVSEKLFANDWLRLSFLRIRGKRVVASCCFAFRDTYSMYLLGMGDTGEAARLSPGILLVCYDLQQAIQEGRKYFDFMRGDARFKYELGAISEPNWIVTVDTTADSQTLRSKADRSVRRFVIETKCRIIEMLASWMRRLES